MLRRIQFITLIILTAVSVWGQNGMSAYEYWLDSDYGGRVMAKGTGEELSLSMTLSGLTSGVHYYNVRCQNAGGEWGSVYRYLFFVPPSQLTAGIARYESWIDSDYVHRATNICSGDSIPQSVDVSSLSAGIHYYNVRCQNAGGEWGSVYRYLFFVPDKEPSETVTTVSYWLNEETEVKTQQVSGSLLVVTADISNLHKGTHTLHCILSNTAGALTDTLDYQFAIDNWDSVANVEFTQNGNQVVLSTETENATIYYALSTSGAGFTVYTEPLMLTSDCTIEAYAVREGYNDSDTTRYEFVYVPEGFATFDGLVATVGGDKTLDDAFVEVGGRSEAAKTIAAVVWEKDAPLTDDMLEGLADNPNLLVYVSNEALALANVKNVVVDGVAKEIVLADTENGNNNFFVPQAFTAERISYSHDYTQQTTPGVSRGWETLVLPFAVQTVTHERNGALLPYKTQPGDKTFWLRTLTADGIKAAQRIVANMPYLISMPNNTDAYDAEYCQGGVVTFASENVTVPETQMTVAALADSSVVLHPTMQRVAQSASVYALNVGEPRGSYLEGSVFERDLRDVRPFECYTEHRGGTGGSRFITLGDMNGGNTMGIDDLQIFDLPICDLPIYNVAGQMVNRKSEAGTSVNSKLPKGVYIQRGRKVVIR